MYRLAEPVYGMVFLLRFIHHKTTTMKIAGMLLIIAGILMLLFRNISFTREEKLIDIGPIEVSKNEKKTIDWPNYAGIIAVVGGLVILLSAKKKQY